MKYTHSLRTLESEVDFGMNKAKIKFQYLLNEVLEHKNADKALELALMIKNKEIKITFPAEDKLLFILHSKYQGKCVRCAQIYNYGDPIFCCNKQAWHLKCRTLEEEKQSFFQTCLKKGLLLPFFNENLKEED